MGLPRGLSEGGQSLTTPSVAPSGDACTLTLLALL